MSRTTITALEAELAAIHDELLGLRSEAEPTDAQDLAFCRLTARMGTCSAQIAALHGDVNASLKWLRVASEWQRRSHEAKDRLYDQLHREVREALAKLEEQQQQGSLLEGLE